MKPDYQTLNDGCEGDSAGLAEALGDDFEVVYENYDAGGYGHHYSNAVFKTAPQPDYPGGRYIHAECGGCSCRGSGSWSYETDEERALRLVPSEQR